MKVAVAQTEPKLAENRRNLETCLGLLEEATAAGAELLVLPECGSKRCRQTQPVSFVSRWIETDVSAEVVRTRWMSSCGGISA